MECDDYPARQIQLYYDTDESVTQPQWNLKQVTGHNQLKLIAVTTTIWDDHPEEWDGVLNLLRVIECHVGA